MVFFKTAMYATCHQPISVADFGWKVKHFKRLNKRDFKIHIF